MSLHAPRLVSLLLLILFTGCTTDDDEPSGSGGGPCSNPGTGTYTITANGTGKRAEVVDGYRFACYDDLVGCLVACFDDCPYQNGDFFRYGVGGTCPGEFAGAVTVAGETYRFTGTRLRAFNGSPGPFASGSYQLYDADDNLIEDGTFTFMESGLANPPAMSSANSCN